MKRHSALVAALLVPLWAVGARAYESVDARDASQAAAAASVAASGVLLPGTVLKADRAVRSRNGEFYLIMQRDGNLVFYRKGGHPLWAASTNGPSGNYAVMQTDGNLVVYNKEKRARWSSRTAGHKGSFAVAQNDGNFVIYDGKKPLWASRSGGHLSAVHSVNSLPSANIPNAPAGSIQAIIERAFAPLGQRGIAWALCIAKHESGFRPNVCYENSQSQACGLFQFEPGTWAGTPYAKYSRFNPVANAEAAKWLYTKDGPWPWSTHVYCQTP